MAGNNFTNFETGMEDHTRFDDPQVFSRIIPRARRKKLSIAAPRRFTKGRYSSALKRKIGFKSRQLTRKRKK